MAMIYIFEPDEQIARKLNGSLTKEKYDVKLCDDQADLADIEAPAQPPLVILDAAMKWSDCRPLFEKCRELKCPVLFVTGDRRMSSHLKALYTGGSEVLTAPFSAKTLQHKVHALLDQREAVREIAVDENERVALLDGRRVELTAQEMALLLALMEKPDAPVSREQLLRKAWGYQSMGETRTVDVHVQRLRKKLGEECIETVYKCGYRLRLA